MFRILYKTFALKIILILLVIFSTVNLVFVYLNTAGPLNEPIELIIERGLSKREIVEKLYEHDIIRFPNVLHMVTKFYGLKYKIKSGEYLFTAQITPYQVLEILTNGKSIVRKFVVPEGFTVRQIFDRLYEETRLVGEIHENITEGFLLPETYFFSYSDQRQMLVEQMKKDMSKLLDELMIFLDPLSPLKTRLDVLKLASIVERETNLDIEKPRVAAVYINRLKKGMKLQADPTTIYAITLGKTALGRQLVRSDLFMESPYNTYMVYGLPPTPIACPGRKAIEAAIKPAKTNEIFFVANGRGGHNFSTNAKDHINNVNNYRKILNSSKK
ncbi:MAG: Aminodeoxychorismate lyase [Rickettsiaceae bacterium]|nr:Aminodeoxychorismate lyase [Rickettsiaceae bacterium]